MILARLNGNGNVIEGREEVPSAAAPVIPNPELTVNFTKPPLTSAGIACPTPIPTISIAVSEAINFILYNRIGSDE